MATISVSIATSADDGRWRATAFSNSDNDTFIGGAADNKGFFRFTGLGALAGATITSASIEFVAAASDSDAAAFVIRARAANNPQAPTTESQANTATRHATTVLWSSVPAFTAGSTYTTPDITTLVQALVNDGYLAAGVILFYLEPNGTTGQRDVASYDHATYAAAKLTVEYVSTVTKTTSDSGTISASESRSIIETYRKVTKADSDTIAASEAASIHSLVATSDSDTASPNEQSTRSTVDLKTTSDSDTISASESSALIEGHYATDSGTVASNEQLDALSALTQTTDSSTISASETPSIGAQAGDDDAAVVVAAETPTVAALTTASDDGTVIASDAGLVNSTTTASDSSTINAVESTIITVIPVTRAPRIALDVYTLAGVRIGSGPIVGAFAADYGQTLDELGTWSARVPVSIANAELLAEDRIVAIRREGEGVVFRGIIGHVDVVVDAHDAHEFDVSGNSIADELMYANTLFGREFHGASLSSAVSTLTSGTGWSIGTIDTGSVSARFDGASIWAALRAIAEPFRYHVRANVLARTVDVGAFGASSGLVFRAVEHIQHDLGVVPLASLTIAHEHSAIWNRVVPLGGGEGINALSLAQSTRTSPYTINSATGPDGRPYYYLDDSASIAAHGLRVKPIVFDQIVPLSNSTAEIVSASNTLYDVAAAWLSVQAESSETYTATVVGLRHIVDGQQAFALGETARLHWRGIVDDGSGRRVWRDIDTDVWIMGYKRTFAPDGSDAWELALSTSDRHAARATDAVVDAINDVWTLKTALRPYTFREVHGPYVESVDSSTSATFRVDYDDDLVTYLHRATLSLRKRRVKSNVSGSSAGGGQTSSSTATAANAGGGQTSQGGTSHTHTITANVTEPGGLHFHVIAQANPTDPWSTPAYMQQVIYNTSPTGFPSYGVYVGRNGTDGTISTLVTQQTQAHTHAIDATASASESSHTHNITAHTHTINAHNHTISDHVHALNYGIFLGPTASTPQFSIAINGVDRTIALGGPWNSNVELDITPYLVDANGNVLRQSNTIEVSANQLCDVELVVKSLVSTTSIIPV